MTNNGTAKTWPVFTVTGPGPLYKITNHTTGDEIQFNLTLLGGETAHLDLRPGYKTFISTFRGNIINSIQTGSNAATFRLDPGDNDVSVLAPGCTVSMAWNDRFWSIDGGSN